MSVTTPVLAVRGVDVRFGGVHVLAEVSLEADADEVVGIIGPNGAGKTTLLDAVTGFVPLQAGSVMLAGREIGGLRPDERARIGVARSFQDPRLFSALTVTETLLVAAAGHEALRSIPPFVHLPGARRRESRWKSSAETAVTVFHLEPYADSLVSELSTGTRRVVELAALALAKPKVLLLDEPSSGIAQSEVEALGAVIRDLRELTGAAVVLVEHDMPLLFGLADHVVALEAGRVLAQGKPAVVRNDPAVLESYLGGTSTATRRRPARRPRAEPQGVRRQRPLRARS